MKHGKGNAIIHGASKIARALVAVARDVPADAEMRLMDVNGAPGLLIRSGDRPWCVVTGDAADERIQSLFFVLNPAKLRDPRAVS